MNEKTLDVSWETILKIAFAFFSFYLIYLVRDILVWFVFAVIISILFNPAIDFLQKRKIPRVIAVIFIYFGVFGILSLLVYSSVAFFIEEIQQFSQLLPQYFEKFSPVLRLFGLPVFENIESFIQTFGGSLDKIASGFTNTLFAFFGGIFSTIFILSMAIFLSLEQKPIEKALSLFFPKKYEAYALSLWARCQKKVSGWFVTRILGCLFVGFLAYFALILFNAKYPLSLGILAGVLNFIPIVGPIITGAIIFLVVVLDNLLRALFVLIAFILIQQIENNVLTPLLSKKFIGLSPVLVLIALALGGKLWGLLGAVLSVPLAGIMFEFLKDFLKKRQEQKPVVL